MLENRLYLAELPGMSTVSCKNICAFLREPRPLRASRQWNPGHAVAANIYEDVVAGEESYLAELSVVCPLICISFSHG